MEKILKKELIASFVVIVICVLLCMLVKNIVRKIFKIGKKQNAFKKQKSIANLISNIIISLIFIISLLAILEIHGIDTKSLLASLGVVGLVAGLAIQDILKDLISGVSFVIEGQFSIGDWVSINNFKGEVIASNLRTTKIRAYTGEVKIISNRNISELINYSIEPTNILVKVSVSYDSNIEKVKSVLNKLSEEIKAKYNLDSVECQGIQDLESSSIDFRIVAKTTYDKHANLERNIKFDIVSCLNKNNIEIPYNQVVVHNGKRI